MSSQKVTRGTPTVFPKLPAQDVLPFPPTPSASIAGRTMQESVYQRRVEPRRLPCRCTEHPDRPHRRCRTRTTHDVRWRSPYAGPRQNLQRRHCLQPIPHHGHVLPDSSIPPDRAEPPSCRGRTDRGDGERLGRVLRGHAQELCDRRGGASALRLYHGRVGQMAQHACRTNNGGGPLRLLADWLRLRLLLWFSLRRSVAVRAQPGS